MRPLLALIPLLLATGCATLVTGRMQGLRIDADAPIAVQVDGRTYEAPCVVPVRRGDPHVAQFPDGSRIQIGRSRWANGWMYGNLLLGLGAGIGMLVDIVSGAGWAIEPEHLYWHADRVWQVGTEELPPESLLAQRRQREAEQRAAQRRARAQEHDR